MRTNATSPGKTSDQITSDRLGDFHPGTSSCIRYLVRFWKDGHDCLLMATTVLIATTVTMATMDTMTTTVTIAMTVTTSRTTTIAIAGFSFQDKLGKV